jgi:hypothetical protein
MSAVSGGRQGRMDAPHSQTTSPRLPTEDHPERGVIGRGDVVLSKAEHFIDEDGTHVIRSLEFDVSAIADDVDTATSVFIDNADDYCSYLAGLARSGTAVQHELETLGLLTQRLLALHEQEREREGDPGSLLAALLHPIRRALSISPPAPFWRPQTTQENSAPPSNG